MGTSDPALLALRERYAGIDRGAVSQTDVMDALVGIVLDLATLVRPLVAQDTSEAEPEPVETGGDA